MPAPTIANTYNATQDSNTTSVAVAVNGSGEFAVGDLIVVFVDIDGEPTTPAVTQTMDTQHWGVQNLDVGQNTWHGCWSRVLQSGETSITQIEVTWSTTNEKACISVNRIAAGDHDGVDVAASSDEGSTTTPSSPSVTTTVANTRVIVSEGHDGAAASTHPSGTTELSDQTPTGGGIVTMSTAHFSQASAGATGAKQWTLDNARSTITGTIAIKPAAGGGIPIGAIRRRYLNSQY